MKEKSMAYFISKRLVIVVAFFCCVSAHAQTHFVRINSTNPVPPYSSWATAATNIQDAIDVATNGALVLVSNGVYQTGGRKVGTQSQTNRVAITNVITVQSVNGPAFTTIRGAWDPLTTNGASAVRGVQFTAAGALIGFTVTGGATGGGNTTTQINHRGGGILCVAGSVVSNCVISGNEAFFSGGGVQGGLIYRTTITGNRAPSGGGARLSSPFGILADCIVQGNVATNVGGGVHLGAAVNTLIVGNTAGGSGGGANGTHLVNCTVVSNTAASGSGMSQGSAANSIIYFNSVSNYNGDVVFTNSCSFPLPTNGVSNIDSIPSFVNATSGNYRLQFGSPGIDAGTNEAVVSSLDFDGKARIVAGTVDMGAYEFGNAPTSAVTSNAVIQGFTSAELRGSVNGGGISASSTFLYQRASVFATTSSPALTIPTFGLATPYPSSITVSGITGVVNEVQVTLDRFSHNFMSDVDILLVGPQGQGVILLSDTGGSGSLFNKRFVFSDRAVPLFVTGSTSFTLFRPTNLSGNDPDTFPPPALTNQVGTNIAAFVGTDPNGVWSLYVVDDANEDSGELKGWSLTFGHGEVWTTPPVALPASTNIAAVSAVVTGLTTGTEYLFRVEASNELGRATGVDMLFRTPGPPEAATLPARVTGPYSAVLRGTVTPNQDATTVYFEYGTTTNYGQVTPSQPFNGTNTGILVESSILLGSDAAVHYRIVASNGLGSAVGINQTIAARRTLFVDINNTTPSAPYLTWQTAATNIQDAVDLAADRDLVMVSNGIYQTGSRAFGGGVSNRIAMTNVITVQSVNGPSATVIRGAFDPNTSSNGPAAIRGVYLTSNAVLSGFTVSRGVANDFGGGILSERGGVITNCVVLGNQSAGQGGGVYGGNLYNCLVESNAASVGGGVAQPNFNGGTTFRSIIRNNRASFDGSAGGLYYGRAVDCLIHNNIAGFGGGVLYTELFGCTVVDNEAVVAGGGAYGSKVFNSILYFNFAPTNANYQIDSIFGATSFVHTCTTPEISGPNNITNDPRFISRATGDFRLLTDSPCINAGDNTLVQSSVDVLGNPRVFGGVVDIGAIEMGLPPVVTTLDPTNTLAGVVLRGQVNPGEEGASWYFELISATPVPLPAVTNAGAIVINDNAVASPYPSTISMTGITSTVLEVEVALESLSHTFPSDIDILLSGPDGQSVILMSDAGGGTDVAGARLVFDDQAVSNLTTAAITGGTYRPTNLTGANSFPSPASTNQLGTNLAVFAGSDPAGLWSLYVVDGAGTDAGVITGWSLRVSVSDEALITAGGSLDATNVFVSVSNAVAGLEPGVPYQYRVVASNNYGITFGTFVDFVVPEPISLTNFVALGSTNPVPPYTRWATAATNIQDAVDVALDGATIFVSNGVYETGGRVNFGSMSNRLVVNKPVIVWSVNGPAVTVIRGAQDPLTTNGNAAMRGIFLTNGASLVGFTVTGGGTRTNGNQALETRGGGIWAVGGCIISNCVVTGNTALVGAGIHGGTITHSFFSGNRASQSGGGVSFFSIPGSISHSVIRDNSAVNNAGGLLAGSASNCLIALNISASNYGAAVNANLAQCTVVGNAAGFNVGGVSGGIIANSIVVSNTAPASPNFDFANFTNCLIQPGAVGGNITNSPLFVDFVAGNFRLLDGSPGVNRGNNALVLSATDLDGNPRIIGARVDIGAYENLGLFTDQDGDGANDYEEYVADTIPTNGASFLQPIGLTNAPPGRLGLVIEPTSTGRLYAIEANTNLLGSPQVWTPIPPEVPGNGGVLVIQVTNDVPARNYRQAVRVP